jgi:hypothetical protein
VTGIECILKHASEFYKTLFDPGSGDAFELDKGLWPPEECIIETENSELTRQFQEKEIKVALFQMERYVNWS